MTGELKNRIEQIKNGMVPVGYQTQKNLGIAPNKWKCGELCDVLKNEQRPVPKPNSEYWRLGLRSHARGTFHELVKDPETVAMDELFEVRQNDLIVNITFAWEHAIALANKDDEGKLVSHRFPTYVFKKSNCAKYYECVVTQKRFKEMLGNISPGGAGRNRVMSRPGFLKLPCYIPPIEEQEKIAEVIAHCEKVIELKKQLLSEERKQKKWLLQNLLNPDSGVRLEGFEDEWKEKTMGELFEFGSSLSASRDQLGESGICYLHYGDIHSNTSGVVDVLCDYDSIPKLSTESVSSKLLLDDGDVVFVDASEDYEGASKYIVVKNENAIPFIAGLHTIPAKSIGNELIIDYKKFCFQSYNVKKQIAFFVSGMKVFGLSKTNIAKIILKYPSTDEQAAIANILNTVDRKIELLDQELELWQQKKKSLMQLLLTGIVRVNV